MCNIITLPIGARALGRVAARNGGELQGCPFDYKSAAGQEWITGHSAVRGIPTTLHERAEFLHQQWEKTYIVMMEFRDDPRVPADIRERARRRLAREDDELREG